MIKQLLFRAWDSPTLTTWSSLVARLGSMLFLLPLVLRHFSTAEVAVWLLFATVASLQLIGDVGFSQTFTRAISNIRGGARVSELGRISVQKNDSAALAMSSNELLRVLSTIRPVYRLLAGVSFGLLLLLSFAVRKPIGYLPNQQDAWLAWIVVIIATTTSVWGNTYLAYLMGMERVAKLRRWETLFALLGIGSASVIVINGGGLLALILTQQIWVIIAVLRNRWLSCQDTAFIESAHLAKDSEVIQIIWPAAWKSGVGVLMSFGLIQSSGFIYAMLASGAQLATYLLGLRIIQVISQLSQAPFYSKIPTLSRLCAQGKVSELLAIAKRGMFFAHLTYLSGFLLAGLLSEPLLQLIHSQTPFPETQMWGLLGLAFFIERIGAMHLQLYSTTNHVIWHIANGLTGVVMLTAGYFLFQKIGVMGFPLAMAISYFAVYCTISCWHSYRIFNLKFIDFDGKISIPPFLMVTLFYSLLKFSINI
ncbi:lipopolysaccharide biosynthesis protein [Polaromonas sp.]|uniref:lipopolysaccharide biosynthesis protein n=1 Tax=Polaromonas sp. TaxID=1869339 RepID=UPI003BB7ADBE